MRTGVESPSTLKLRLSVAPTRLAPGERGTLMSLVSLANGIGTGLVPLVIRTLSANGSYAMITLVLGATGLGVAVIVSLFVIEQRKSDLVSR